MKKIWIVLVGLIFVSGLIFAQTSTNFKKATTRELAKAELELHLIKTDIESFANSLADNDAEISGKEMKTLKKMVKRFDKAKKEFDKE